MGVGGGREVEEERLQEHWLEQSAIWHGVEKGAELTWLGAYGAALGRGPVGSQLLGLPGKPQALLRSSAPSLT